MRALPSNKLNKKVVSVWRIDYFIYLAFLTIIAVGVLVVLNYFVKAELPLGIMTINIITVAALVALFIVYLFVVPAFRYARWHFEVTKTEVDIAEGILIRRRTIIPLVRVQTVNTSQGPVLRLFGLSTVHIETAAGAHAIPALSSEEADKLRDHISALARVAQEDV